LGSVPGRAEENPCKYGGRKVAALHSHNIGRATVRSGGLEDFELGPINPSEGDIKNKEDGVRHYVVGEIYGVNLPGAMTLWEY
jgi:hypothetical protein